MSFSNGLFHEEIKKSNDTPISNYDNRTDKTNYRPNSKMNISKMLQKEKQRIEYTFLK